MDYFNILFTCSDCHTVYEREFSRIAINSLTESQCPHCGVVSQVKFINTPDSVTPNRTENVLKLVSSDEEVDNAKERNK